MAFLELLVVICGLYGAYATASTRRRQRQLGFIIFTIGALSSIPLYFYKDLLGLLMLSVAYLLLDVRGIITNRKIKD